MRLRGAKIPVPTALSASRPRGVASASSASRTISALGAPRPARSDANASTSAPGDQQHQADPARQLRDGDVGVAAERAPEPITEGAPG